MIEPLKNRTYRRLFSAQVVALLGTGLSTVALMLLAYELAGGNAGVVLGTALALKMVAYVGVAPVVGGFAHRLPRRRTLIKNALPPATTTDGRALSGGKRRKDDHWASVSAGVWGIGGCRRSRHRTGPSP